MKSTFKVVLLFVVVLSFENSYGITNSAEGVWKIVRVIVHTPEGDIVNSNPLPSQIIFTKKHFSFIRLPRKQMQPNYLKRWYPTDEEKIESYNSIVVNAGEYKIEKSILTIRPAIAKTPDFVGGFARYEFALEDGHLLLTLIDNVSNDGTQDSATLQNKTTLFLERINEEE
jgi:hypothetical protein